MKIKTTMIGLGCLILAMSITTLGAANESNWMQKVGQFCKGDNQDGEKIPKLTLTKIPKKTANKARYKKKYILGNCSINLNGKNKNLKVDLKRCKGDLKEI
jgi:hypothetical protein